MNRIPTLSSFVAMAIACVVASGCASMTGVGGTSEYSCKAPEGVKCDSVSGTYYNSVENNLPSQRQDGDLMDQLYVYVPVDNGRWLVDHTQRQIRDAYAPIKAPRTAQAPDGDVERESADAETRVPAASALERRLQAARGLGPSAANANGANDAR